MAPDPVMRRVSPGHGSTKQTTDSCLDLVLYGIQYEPLQNPRTWVIGQ